MELIDIGANLGHESFAEDLPAVLARARAAGVVQMLVTGASVAGSRDALAIARSHRGLSATAGIHPHHAADLDAEAEAALAALMREAEVCAGGETGLDYYRDFCPHPVQQRAFERQLALTVAAGKPAFLHERDAYPDFAAQLKGFRDALPAAVVHCFTGSREALFAYLDLGCHIGITGWICDERRGLHLRELVPHIPADRLLLETDSPYLLPRDLPTKPKSRRNEPMYLGHICRVVAHCRQQPPEQLAAQTSANARAVFGLAEPSRD